MYDAVKREVFEETGLNVLEIFPDIKTKKYSPRDDGFFTFHAFCSQQQIKDGKPRIGFVFIFRVEDKEPKAQQVECKDIRWIKKSKLKKNT